MAAVKALVLRSPGTNCNDETQFAFELAGANCQQIHINQLLEKPDTLRDFQILCVAGGFSYGDDIAAGRILAAQMRQRLADALHQFREAGKLMLGICNGFQVLMNTGLFESTPDVERSTTLTWNNNGRYEARWVNLKTKSTNCVFLRNVENMYLPIAHAEGKLVGRNQDALNALVQNDQLALSYSDESNTSNGTGDLLPFPINPNGSERNIAGICDATGRVFGLMPHPERYVDPTHHPHWTRYKEQPYPDGRLIFDNAVSFFQ